MPGGTVGSVTLKGRPAHVGVHYRGLNAFEQLLKVANRLLALKSEVEEHRTSFAIEPEDARQSIMMLGGEVFGGDNFNLVPASLSFTLDRRFNPEEALEEVRQKLIECFQELEDAGVQLEVEFFQEAASAASPAESEVGCALADSVERVTGKTPRFEMCPGLLEIRFYTERGIPAYAYGPGLLSVSHGPSEFVRLSDVYQSAKIYALTAARVFDNRKERSGLPSSSPRS